MFNELEYERKVIEVFGDIGYKYKNSNEMLIARRDLSTVILYDVLEESIKKINKGISQSDINSIVDEVRKMDDSNLLKANSEAVKVLSQGVKVHNLKDERTYTYKIIDFENIENNSYIITDQFKMTSNHINYSNQIPDLVVFLNGLPVSVIELKSPTLDESKSIEDAFDQVKNYQKNMPTLFTWNIINTISNMNINRYGSLTSPYSRYSNWRDVNNGGESPFIYFFKELYSKKNILRVLKDFTFYTKGDELNKIVAGYHQITGVTEAANKVIEAIDNKTGKAGIFWHTQGSGKSLSMVFLTRLVNNIKTKMTTLVITDRKDLDTQLSSTFINAKDFLGQEVKQIESISDLKLTLNNKVQNGIYLCTVQKFDESISELSKRDDILVISDEAHRSHKNINARLEAVEDEMVIKEKLGHAYYLRKSFPNATFIGFTGTPIETDDHQTKEIFGSYATKYLMSDAESDGFVVPLKYESRHAKLAIASKMKKELDEFYETLKNEVVENSDLKPEVQKHLNSKLQKMDMIIGDPARIKEVSEDFVKHYRTRSNLLKGKAMFVAYNRDIAFKYYKEIISIDPTLEKNIRVILTANNQKDSAEMLKIIGTDKYRKESASEFKDPDSDFKIVIVVDMWLTGFDAPSLDTIYLDKPIKMHNLMQTIARVNRTYTDKNNKELVKESGLVVDYIGLWQKLQLALAFYTGGGDTKSEIGPEDINLIKDKVMEYVNLLYKTLLNDEIKINEDKLTDKSYLFDVVEDIQRVVTKIKEKQLFVSKVKSIKKHLPSIISICTELEKTQLQLLIAARSMLIKRALGEVDIDLKIKELKEIIAESIIHNRTIINTKISGEEISLTDIVNYISKVDSKTVDALDLDKLTNLIKKGISRVKNFNIVRADKLTEKLQSLLDKYDSNHISEAEFAEDLIKYGNILKEVEAEYDVSDRDMMELAFFEIMSSDDYSKTAHDIEMINSITQQIYSKVKPLLTKRWIYNESVKQKVRSEMVKILILEGYPREEAEKLRSTLIKQLELQIQQNIIKLEDDE